MSNLKNYLFTSESVSEGHPDKVSDRISDMVVDSYLSGDPFSRVACETMTTTNKVVLAGEVRGPEIKKDELIEKVRISNDRNGVIRLVFDLKGRSFIEKNANITELEMSVVDRSILRMSVCEFLFRKDIPKKVIMDESIKIAKKFSYIFDHIL